MCPYTTFLCTKFEDNRITCFHISYKDEKKKKKNKETKPIFESSYLGNAWRNLVENLNVGYWWWRASPQQKLSGFVQAA